MSTAVMRADGQGGGGHANWGRMGGGMGDAGPSGPRGMAGGPGPVGRGLPPQEPVDREKTCPLLMRVFQKVGGHHRLEDFAVRGKEPKDEIQIYTWMDATLRELSDLIKEVNPAARAKGSRLSFAFVYPDRRGRNVMRQVGGSHTAGCTLHSGTLH